jgi:F-type H+-transporting ATPase subunit gamma
MRYQKMSNSILRLKRKMNSADDLHSVVRSMKSIAAANISQYEQAALSLNDYSRTIELGLIASLQKTLPLNTVSTTPHAAQRSTKAPVVASIFGSDQGLVGQFNEKLQTFMHQTLASKFENVIVWHVGERLQNSVKEHCFNHTLSFALPRKIDTISPLVTELLFEIEAQREHNKITTVYLFFNRPDSTFGYLPSMQNLLPLDAKWQRKFASQYWQGRSIPELVDGPQVCISSLIGEYLFVSLFKACTESIASENAFRLSSMQRAEKNIEKLKDGLYRNYYMRRQESIDNELFDLVSGFKALNDKIDI